MTCVDADEVGNGKFWLEEAGVGAAGTGPVDKGDGTAAKNRWPEVATEGEGGSRSGMSGVAGGIYRGKRRCTLKMHH